MSIKVVFDPSRGLVQSRGPASFVISSGSTVDLGSSAVYAPQNPGDWSAVPVDVIQAIDYLAAGSGSGGGGGGGYPPGGSDGQMQYRVNSTTFGGTDKLTIAGGNLYATGSFKGDIVGTASFSSNSDLLDGLNSTAFARLSVANIFNGKQTVTGTIDITGALSSSVVVANGTGPVVVLSDSVLGQFMTIDSTSYQIELTTPGDTTVATMSPTDISISLGDGSPTANGSAGEWKVIDSGGTKIRLSIIGGIPTLSSVDGAENPYPIDLKIDELGLNSNPGSPGHVIISQGANMPPVWGDSPYTAAVPGDWSGTPPTTVAEALDRIAAAIGPIA